MNLAMDNKLLEHFKLASNTDLHHGMQWYRDAHNFCLKVAKWTRQPLFRVVGVMSALSPRNKWGRNKIDTIELIRKRKRGKYATFNNNRDKAIKILNAKDEKEVIAILSGMKTVSFYKNILRPYKNDTVTVDIWAMRSVGLDKLNRTSYNATQDAYRRVSNKLGIKAHELQAIIWSVVRQGSK